jgi:hypothetical protein
MRNFLFAAMEAGATRSFGLLVITSEKTSENIKRQVHAFESQILKPRFQSHVVMTSYEELANLTSGSWIELGWLLNQNIPRTPPVWSLSERSE